MENTPRNPAAFSIPASSELGYPVVSRSQGGQKGGRSWLTDRGRELLRAYEAYTQRVRATADELFAEYFPDLFK